ncbi:MAG: DUF6228 family protein [Oculatellaceae cyanobacterium Prado106]|nr:DUF6228 family protein [Oculatellaceae cyanobacterium Prado106]
MGEKSWGAIAGKFYLSCASDSLGHITLAAELIERYAPEPWSVKFKVAIEAGQLEKLANEIRKLFKGV